MRDEEYQATFQETDYPDPTLSPSIFIEMNQKTFQSLAVPTLEITPVPSKNKLKLKDYDFKNNTHFGYDSDNQCGTFIDSVAGEYDYYDEKGLPGSMMGYCRNINDTQYESDNLVLLSNS